MIVEDIYAQGIAHSFLIAVPFAVISLIAIIFLPNKPLTRMTTSERIAAGEADLATVSHRGGDGRARRDRYGSDPRGCRTPANRRTTARRLEAARCRSRCPVPKPERRAPRRCAPSRPSSAS